MADKAKRPRFTREELLDIGRRAHEKVKPIGELATEFGVHKSKIFEAQRQYRDSIGYTAEAPTKAVPTVTARVAHVIPQQEDPRIRILAARVDELEDELTTMRKILMTVGRAL